MEGTPAQPANAQHERHRAPRYPFEGGLEIDWGSTTIRGKVLELSAEGMFIETHETLWVGARFTSRLFLEPPLAVDCVVRRVVPGHGMGLSFTLNREEDRLRLTDLLETLASK